VKLAWEHGQGTWHQIGPCALEGWGAKWIAVRCPREHAALMRGAGGQWEPGRRVWLIGRRRIGPVMRALERVTDPLFRQAGIDLDELTPVVAGGGGAGSAGCGQQRGSRGPP
jgi:hypothetical protein